MLPEDALTVTGDVAIYDRHTEDRMSRQCSCPVSYTRGYNTNTARPGMVVQRADRLDESDKLGVVARIWVKRKQRWIVIADCVPQWNEGATPEAMAAALAG